MDFCTFVLGRKEAKLREKTITENTFVCMYVCVENYKKSGIFHNKAAKVG